MEQNSEGEVEEEGGRKQVAEECECEEGAPAWVVTFGDLMSLLLTFFVLLLSFSRMDSERFKELAGSLKEAFGVQRIVPAFDLPRGIDLVARDFNTVFRSEMLEQKIKAAVKRLKKELEEGEKNRQPGETSEAAGEDDASGGLSREETAVLIAVLEEAIEVEEDATGYTIRLDGSALFASGKGDLSPTGVLVMRAVQPAVLGFGGDLLVEGHTDSVPFGGGPGVDDGNWKLSFDRAHAVVRYLHEHLGIGLGRIGLVSRGPSRPRATNDTAVGRALNRRVEIVLLKSIAERPAVQVAEAPAELPEAFEDEMLRPLTAAESGETVIPEANFSPLEHAGYGVGGPRSLFPE